MTASADIGDQQERASKLTIIAQRIAFLAGLFYAVSYLGGELRGGQLGLGTLIAALMIGGALLALASPLSGGVVLLIAGAGLAVFLSLMIFTLTTVEDARLRGLFWSVGQAAPALASGALLTVADLRSRRSRGASAAT